MREMTPGRYALDGTGRLYHIRGAWRRKAVAIVIVKPRARAAAERTARPPSVIPAQMVAGLAKRIGEPYVPPRPAAEQPATLVEQLQKIGEAIEAPPVFRQSTARFKPLAPIDEDAAAARAYQRAVEGRQGRD